MPKMRFGKLNREIRKIKNSIFFKYFKDTFFISIFLILLYFVVFFKIYFLINSPWNIFLHLYTILTSLFILSRFVISYFYSDEHSGDYHGKKFPTVSFVIACKNEEGSIARTIDTCLLSDYPGKLECIAIDDGSTDNTLKEMMASKNNWRKNLTVIAFPENKGKREGMSEGVLQAKGEIIIFVDSDTFVKKDAVRLIVEHFLDDPEVGAVSGNSQVENKDVNLLTKMQSARYGVSFDIFKTSESVFGTVTCCPGCFSAYRKSAILDVLNRWRYQKFLGSRSTFGDDRSLTNYVMRTWKVVYCRKAIATTIVPEKYKTFFKQQLRWKKSWIREGTNAGSFIWRKNPIASISFYVNLIIPIFGPLIVLKILLLDTTIHGKNPLYYFMGLVVMSLLLGIYYYLLQRNKYWWYVIFFTVLNAFILVWQMPVALLKIRDNRWGTR